jgi:large subunit ribosomal protein L24
MSIKKNDKVVVISGKERGKQGTVEKIIRENSRIIVAGVNMRTKHLKRSQSRPQGGIVEVSGSMHASNVMVVCPHCSKPTRIANTVTETNKYRSCTHCKDSLD